MVQHSGALKVDENGSPICAKRKNHEISSRSRKLGRDNTPSSMLMRVLASGLRATRAMFLRFSNERVRDLLLEANERQAQLTALLPALVASQAASSFSCSSLQSPAALSSLVQLLLLRTQSCLFLGRFPLPLYPSSSRGLT